MSDQEQQSTEAPVSSENPEAISNEQNQSSNTNENESNQSEQRSPRRVTIPQDIRYSTEQNERETLIEKYNNYQISDTNACNIRFVTDNRQRKFLLGRTEEENSNLHSLAKTFNVNMFPGYQHTVKHSYKIFGTEANVRKCLIEIMNRMFKRSNRVTKRDDKENNNQQSTPNIEKSQETEVSTDKEKVDDKPSSIFVTTTDPDSSITEEQKPVTPNVGKSEETEDKEKVDDKPTSIFVTTINPDSSITGEQKPVTPNVGKSEETEDKEKVDDKPTSIFVTTINPDSSITEEQKPVTPNTEKTEETEDKEKVDDKPTSIFVTTINPDSSITEEQKPVTPNTEKTEETEAKGQVDDKPTSIFVTTINPDSSITEEQKPITPATPNTNDGNNEIKNDNIEQEQFKFIPLERKPEYTFVMLISSQGQEVLKKNWSFFAGSLQQRLNVIVMNPVKLPRFGDKQVQNELSITGELLENLTDATLQIASFINDVLGVPVQPYNADEEQTSNDNTNHSRPKTNNNSYRSSPGQTSSFNNYHEGTFFNRNRNGAFEQVILIRSDCVARIVGTRGSNIKRIQAKCHLRDMFVARQVNENGYVECTLSAYQSRNLHFAIDTIRSFLHNEDESAVQVIESNYEDGPSKDSPHLHELAPPNTEQSSELHTETGFTSKSLHFNNSNQYPQPSYNFQNTPSFDFTHQATSASRKTDKRPGEIPDGNNQMRTPNESQTQPFNYSSISPRHKSKRSCPETKEIDCSTDDGFWIQKQYYYALDETSKGLFDSLIEKLDKIRITTEENAVRKHQRLVGRNRSNKTRVYTSSNSHSNEDNNRYDIKSIQNENNSQQSTEEKENKQEPTVIIVNEN